jgi:hypothetical protein
MTTRKKSRYLKAAALLVVISTLAYAVFNFDPSTQPLVTLAPYGLKSADLATPNNRAYRPWLENGAYQGDVIEYNIDSQGNRTTTDESLVGLNPLSDAEKTKLWDWGKASIGNDYTADDPSPHNWTARATFYANECADATCTSYTTYWQDRHIFTNNAGKVDFTWDNLSVPQKQALDPVAYNNNATQSEVLNYIRGDHTNEKNQPNGTLRSRFSLLGDIVDSSPVYIGQPVENYVDTAFQTFKDTYTTAFRPGLIAVGANDGMLHVFSAKDGSEVYAYIPSMLIGNLPKLAVPPPYVHTYYVDGRLTVASAKIGADWKTILTGGLGAGGKGLFGLDVTSETPANHSILFEQSSSEFGYIYGRPTIYGMADGDWYVITGNGYGAGRAKLLLINLRTKAVTPINTLDNDATAGLSEPTLIDFNNDQVGDYVYAGDTNGNMWKFDFTGLDPANPDLANPVVTKVYAGSPDQPVTNAPEIGEHPNGGYMVYFATGNASSLADAADTSYPRQAVYGIWDQAAAGSVIKEQQLGQATGTFSSTTTVTNPDGSTSTTTTSNTETVRYVSSNPLLTGNYEYICPVGDNTCTALKGWKVTLGANERLISGPPQLRAGRLTFVDNNPTGTNINPDTGQLTSDLEGDGWLFTFDYLTGGDGVGTDRAGNYGGVALNLSGDDQLNDDDRISVNGVLKAPVGLDLGEGVISQPAIARLGPAIDIMYINGLKLKLPQVEPGGPFFNGHIDVVTDSPEGGLKAPNDISYMSEGYNVKEKDGYGKAVDGLVHAYSDIHGITYVDLFELEPRRGMTSKDGTPFPPFHGACPANSTAIYKTGDTTTPYGCVVTSLDAELNRAYDTLTRTDHPGNDVTPTNGTCPSDVKPFGPFYTKVYDSNNVLINCKESSIDPNSEVLLGGTPIDKTKPFIVTLANADLSTAGILQIGCRTWKVEDYEDMITSQLEATGATPAGLHDTIHGLGDNSLLFTLDDIANGTQDKANGIACPKDSPNPTLRISFEQRSILDLGIVGARSQCVLGLHKPTDKVCYTDAAVLSAAESIVPKIEDKTYTTGADSSCGSVADPGVVPDPPVNNQTYLQDPAQNWHITWNPNLPQHPTLTGFRWRNGALVLQLLDASKFTLQPKVDLLVDKNGNRKGGTFAKAFDAAYDQNGKPTGEIINRDSTGGGNQSGLLYEADIYWHYGRLADDIRNADVNLGTGNPASTPCYGDSNYYSRLQIEASGANPGEVNRIINKSISESQLIAYFQALQKVQNCSDSTSGSCNQALLELAQMLADNPNIALLDSILPYVNLDDLNLPPGVNDGGDSTPNRDVEALDITEGVKPQYIKNQRRSWIDLRP